MRFYREFLGLFAVEAFFQSGGERQEGRCQEQAMAMSRVALLLVWSLVPCRTPCAVAITPPVPPREPRSPNEK